MYLYVRPSVRPLIKYNRKESSENGKHNISNLFCAHGSSQASGQVNYKVVASCYALLLVRIAYNSRMYEAKF